MNRFIKQVGIGLSAIAMSFATLAAAPIASSTYAEETTPDCVQYGDGSWLNCIYGKGQYDVDTQEYANYYAVRANAQTMLGGLIHDEAKDYISYSIKDTSIAQLIDEEHTSGDYKYTSTFIKTLKAGKTELVYKLKSTGEVLLSVPITVYELAYTNYLSIAVGASRTFTITPGSDVEVTSVEIASGLSKYATLKANGGNSYTLTVNAMPYGLIGLGAEEEEALPWINLTINAKNKTTGQKYDTEYMVFNVYESKTEDKASESTSSMAAELINITALRETTNALLDVVLGDAEVTDGSVVTLANGSKFSATDIAGLKEAFAKGETIEVSLAKPAVINKVDATVSNKMEAELPANTKGARYLDINVLVSAGNKTFGNITEVSSALTVNVDVSEDGAPTTGFTRSYYVVRLHDGAAERLDASYDKENKTVSFASDKFSTYLIAYEDTKTIAAPDSGVNTKTAEGASANYAALAAIATFITLVGAAFILAKKNA